MSNDHWCLPLAAFVIPTSKAMDMIKICSATYVAYRCVFCSAENKGLCKDLRRQSMICRFHKINKGGNQKRYSGSIPSHISRPIRAGLLRNIDNGQLAEFVASLDPICYDTDPISVARKYISDISQFDTLRLADNCFWGDDSASRVKKERYQQKKKFARVK